MEMTPNQKRTVAASLTVSLVAIAGVMNREGFTDHAVIPVPGDRPTYGHGSTFRPDGSPVQMGDTITRTEARTLVFRDMENTYAAGIRKCAGNLMLLQREFDFLVDSADNLGVKTVCNSSMIVKFRSGDYPGGCAAIKKYKFFHKKDCTIPANKCAGIPIDRERAYRMCMGIS